MFNFSMPNVPFFHYVFAMRHWERCGCMLLGSICQLSVYMEELSYYALAASTPQDTLKTKLLLLLLSKP
jgi:ATP adenylyltransferase/5',5'''-P-1,P-4-tetraphosphate phosphorylase II